MGVYVYGFLWVYVYLCMSWVSMGIHGSLWMFTGIYECLWVSWVSMGIYGFLWVSMSVGFRVFMGVMGVYGYL